MVVEDLEHRTCGILGVDEARLRKVCSDPGKEFLARADPFWLSGWMPRLVIDTADQHWELIAELSRLVDCQAIAQAMQHRAQGLVSATATGANDLIDFLEPYIRLVKRFVEHFEAGQAHGRALCVRRARR